MRFDRLPFSPRLIQARWTLGKLPSEEAPKLAQVALELGFDGNNIRRLAGFINPIHADLLPLMPRFFGEMGIAVPMRREEAAWSLARHIAKAISEGQITPYEGAKFIWHDIVNEVWPNEQHPLLYFVGCASDYEDCASYSQHPEQRRREIEQEIIEEARTLLNAQE